MLKLIPMAFAGTFAGTFAGGGVNELCASGLQKAYQI